MVDVSLCLASGACDDLSLTSGACNALDICQIANKRRLLSIRREAKDPSSCENDFDLTPVI